MDIDIAVPDRPLTGYNVQIGVRIEDADVDLEHVLSVLAKFDGDDQVPSQVQLRVVDGPTGHLWALLDGVIESDSPAAAAMLVERWMTRAGRQLPPQGAWSGGLWAHLPDGHQTFR